MKLNRWFVIGILVFLVVMFIVELQLPKNFSWNPTFRHADRQPFGCYLFDSLLATTMPQGYTVTDSTLWQLAQDSTRQRGILVVAGDLNLQSADVSALMTLANNGSHVMLVAHQVGDLIEDTLCIGHRGYSNDFNLQQFVKYNKEREQLNWMSDTMGFTPRSYAAFPPLLRKRFWLRKDSLGKVLRPAIDVQAVKLEDPVSATFQQGRGYISYVSVPLLFTNYGVVDQDNVGFILRELTLLKHLPVVRVEAYCPASDSAEQSPLRYFLSQPPLRWAIYTAMVGALLFLIFGGRRRQRVIPIEKEPENHSMEFIGLVGSLYYHSHERRSLVVRKWTYFAEELRRNIHVDVTDASEDDQTLPLLARQADMDEQEIRELVLRLRQLVAADDDTEISRKQMKQYIDQMNWIIDKI